MIKPASLSSMLQARSNFNGLKAEYGFLGIKGIAGEEPDQLKETLEPLFKAIVSEVKISD